MDQALGFVDGLIIAPGPGLPVARRSLTRSPDAVSGAALSGDLDVVLDPRGVALCCDPGRGPLRGSPCARGVRVQRRDLRSLGDTTPLVAQKHQRVPRPLRDNCRRVPTHPGVSSTEPGQ